MALVAFKKLGQGFVRVVARYGFMQTPNVSVVLRLCKNFGLEVDSEQATFYLGRETLIPTVAVPGMTLWRDKLFNLMFRNATQATAFYKIPPRRVVELGMQIEI
jgi:KUP system potassium uptake protein